jgi:hypothetical protein
MLKKEFWAIVGEKLLIGLGICIIVALSIIFWKVFAFVIVVIALLGML